METEVTTPAVVNIHIPPPFCGINNFPYRRAAIPQGAVSEVLITVVLKGVLVWVLPIRVSQVHAGL